MNVFDLNLSVNIFEDNSCPPIAENHGPRENDEDQMENEFLINTDQYEFNDNVVMMNGKDTTTIATQTEMIMLYTKTFKSFNFDTTHTTFNLHCNSLTDSHNIICFVRLEMYRIESK